jgi:hypothetical protein
VGDNIKCVEPVNLSVFGRQCTMPASRSRRNGALE